MTENYFEAAIRHYVDAVAMQREEKYDSAVCLYGNSAECVLKELIRAYLGSDSREILMRKYNHNGEELKNDLFDFIANSGDVPLLDPALGLKLRDFILPDILFWNIQKDVIVQMANMAAPMFANAKMQRSY